MPVARPVTLRVARAAKVIGMPVTQEQCVQVLQRLGLSLTQTAGLITVVPPAYRFDIQIEEDLIEEIARVYGFDRIPANPPVAPAAMRVRPEASRDGHSLRRLMAARDFFEVINYSFVDAEWESDFGGRADPIKVRNPIAGQYSVMRTTLLGSLVANLRYNLNRKHDRIRVFEVARVFFRDPGAQEGPNGVAGVSQPIHIGAIACGPVLPEQWGSDTRGVDFFDLKADLESLLAPATARFESASHPALHPGRSAKVVLDGRPIGWIGELHPRLQRKYELQLPAVCFEIEVEPLRNRNLPRFEVVSKFPPMVRDLSILVPDVVPVQEILDAMRAGLPSTVKSVDLFDLYRGKGVAKEEKSLAFRVVMQDTARTLTDEEADAIKAGLLNVLKARFGAKLRA